MGPGPTAFVLARVFSASAKTTTHIHYEHRDPLIRKENTKVKHQFCDLKKREIEYLMKNRYRQSMADTLQRSARTETLYEVDMLIDRTLQRAEDGKNF